MVKLESSLTNNNRYDKIFWGNKMKIGITTRLNEENILAVKPEYIKYLEENKLSPVVLKYDDIYLDEKIASCDGFIISGGDDIDPSFYGESNKNCLCTLKEIDLLDKRIVEYCANNKIPLLGICRGMQAINVFLGGSLYQDIPNHKDRFHEVVGIDPLFEDKFSINSMHHQAIKDLAKGLKVIAICAEDENIEAVMHEDLPIIGCQWHPEQMASSFSSKALINKFKEYLDSYGKTAKIFS